LDVSTVLEAKWPVLAGHGCALEWLQVWADLGRAPGTIDAYARGLAEYLAMCERKGIDPVTANRAHVAAYVKEGVRDARCARTSTGTRP
jgi:integrase/recombinase XerD